MKHVALWLGMVLFGAAGTTYAAEADAQRAFDRLSQLAGSWKGSYAWSGGRSGSGAVRATYYATGRGSAVIENLMMNDGPDPSMTSAYHMDGSTLRMTHYCAARNQPRLKATEFGTSGERVRFSFVDATNLAAQAAHVTALEVQFLARDRLVLRFTFGGGAAKESVEEIRLSRVDGSSSNPAAR